MARIRTIKPELWTDPEFVECSANARLLFVAALNFASDYGVLPDKPLQLKMQCLPGDNVDIEELIEELIAAELWLRTTAPDGAKVLLIRTFALHQRVDKPNDGRWGNPEEWQELPEHSTNHSGNVPRTIEDHSPPEGNGREGITGREGSNASHEPEGSSNTPTARHEYSTKFEDLWQLLPTTVGKKQTYEQCKNRIAEGATYDQLRAAAINYVTWCRSQDRKMKDPQRFYAKKPSANGPHWPDFIECPGTPLDHTAAAGSALADALGTRYDDDPIETTGQLA